MKYFYFFKKIKEKKIKINFKKISSRKIVVFDGVSFNDLKYLLEDYDYQIIENRAERLKEINLSVELILSAIKNFFLIVLKKNFSLPILYYYTIIKLIKPKIIITSIDNSFQFFYLAKLLKDNFIFLAVQNANRLDYEENYYNFKNKISRKNYNSEIFIPNFFCFGSEEERLAKYYNLKIDKFYKFGSIRTANFFYYLNKNKIDLKKNLFDICLISEPGEGYDLKLKVKTFENGLGNLAKYAIKFSLENDLRFVFASKRYKKDTERFNQEIGFYKKHLNQKEFNYLLANLNERKNFYSSYFAVFQSHIAIACQSTLLRDKIGLRQKILSCNLTRFKMYDFPINGLCTLNNCNYDEFAKRLNNIINLSDDEYFKSLSKDKDYVMRFDKNQSTIEKIRLEIDKNLGIQ